MSLKERMIKALVADKVDFDLWKEFCEREGLDAEQTYQDYGVRLANYRAKQDTK